MAEIVSANLPLEITYLSAPGQKLDEGIIFEKDGFIYEMVVVSNNFVNNVKVTKK